MIESTKRGIALGAALLLCLLAHAHAGEDLMDRHKDIKLPVYEDNVLKAMLKARSADAINPMRNHPVINLRQVHILVYDKLPTSPTGLMRDEQPPLTAEITSDRGVFERRGQAGDGQEDIARLEGNVAVKRYVPSKQPGTDASPETEVKCDNATWNHRLGVLTGTGPVRVVVLQTGEGASNTTITGTDYRYIMRTEGDKTPAPSHFLDSEDNPGGGVELYRNVMMYSRESAPDGGASLTTEVKCRGPAKYDVDHREVSFEKDVHVNRDSIEIFGDYLKASLGENPESAQSIREIIAWSTKHGEVRIKGSAGDTASGERPVSYTARGEYAHFDQQSKLLVLKDRRRDRVPVAQWGEHEISDKELIFHVDGGKLQAKGGRGKVRLAGGTGTLGPSPQGGKTPTTIHYRRRLFYDRGARYALFEGGVTLVNDRVKLVCDSLRVEFTEGETPEVARALAEGNVVLTSEGRRATSSRMELLPQPTALREAGNLEPILCEKVVLSGTPTPEIEMEGNGGFFQAPQIVLKRFAVPDSPNLQTTIDAVGPGSGVFNREANDPDGTTRVLGAEEAGAAQQSVIVRYSERMLYDETTEKVRFAGNVLANSEGQVLRSDELIITLKRIQDLTPGREQSTRKTPRMLEAVGHATLHWGKRHCEGHKIVHKWAENRDERQGEIVLYGLRTQHARIWEEGGPRFSALMIRARADGGWVYSHGGGDLTLNDGPRDEKAVVTYEKDAIYTAGARGGRVVFKGNVVMRRPDMTVTGDEMEAQLEGKGTLPATTPATGGPGGASESAVLNQQLKRVIVRGNVVILTRDQRQASGAEGIVDITPIGEVMTLKGPPRGRAEVRDNQGMRLFAPQITVKQGAGVVIADGPGEVQIASLDTSTVRETVYTLNYDGELVYNMLARKIRFDKNVHLKQANVRGRCDHLTVLLNKSADMEGLRDTGLDRMQMQILAIEAAGDVRFMNFEPIAEGMDVAAGSFRPGRTVYTRSNEAYYDVVRHNILLTGGPPAPEAILAERRPGAPPLGRRFQAPKIYINTLSRDVKMRGKPQGNSPYDISRGLPFDME